MRFTSAFSAAALAATSLAQLNLVYQFENAFSGKGYVNIENIIVRPSGDLLLNTVTGAVMAQLNPANPQPEVVVNITNALGNGQPGSLTGIAQTSCKDHYTVAAGNFQFGPQVPGGIAGIPGSFSVWNVDFSKGGDAPKVNLVTKIPEANFLNGVTAIPGGNKDLVLIADSNLGAVWKVNIKTGEYSQVIQNALFQPNIPANLTIGINGVNVMNSYLYFTNSAQESFGAVPINLQTGEATNAPQVFNTVPGAKFDDFDFKPNMGGAWVAAQGVNAIYQITQQAANLVAGGGGQASPLLGPTSTAFGNDGCTLYITTGGVGGGPSGPQSGQVFSLNTCGGAKMAKKWMA